MSPTDWLLGFDPAIRWQAMRDLTNAPGEVVAAERAKVATQGWSAQLLARQTPDGQWGGDGEHPDWMALETLLLLRSMGLDPSSNEAQRAITVVREKVTWHGVLPQDAEWHGKPLLAGEVEPCINGRVVAVGAYFGEMVQPIVDRLLGEQMADGRWNCEDDNGSVRGSFHTTLNVLEGLLENERASAGTDGSRAARLRGEEFLLERRMFRRLSTGDIADPAFTQLSFPNGYHYDVLRGLDYLRAAGALGDERAGEAMRLVDSKRDADGRWTLEMAHPNHLAFPMDEEEGRPSPWITLRALRVL